MENRYSNRKIYFEEQAFTTSKFVIPYIRQFKEISSASRILEIGCGEGGNLKPFVDLGCDSMGIDINSLQIEIAKDCFHENKTVQFIASDIYLITEQQIGKFDVIMLRDVIEHIPNQKQFLAHLKQFLTPNGIVYFGFPPWQMPYGGHQQSFGGSKIIKLPWIHLLPKFLYALFLRTFGISKEGLKDVMDIKDTGISIERFRKIVRQNNYKILDETMFFINPNYEVKFKLKTRKLFWLFTKIPFLRNFYTTCCYYIISL